MVSGVHGFDVDTLFGFLAFGCQFLLRQGLVNTEEGSQIGQDLFVDRLADDHLFQFLFLELLGME